MSTVEPIPLEIQAGVEANALFDALRRGDYATAARAQERLREMGWHLSREASKPQRSRQQRPQPEARPEGVGA
jgi:hypothetical protein